MKLSVIVCTYNYAHFLADALRSLAAQNFQEFELLIVDDGSTDDTSKVVERLARNFRNCNYVKKPHTGLPDSRNIGVELARGTHIAFLDADDLWLPHCLDTFRRAYESNGDAELVCCDGLRVLATGTVRGTLFPPGLVRVLGEVNSVRELFSFFPYVAPSAMMFLRACYNKVGPFDPRFPIGNDWHWVIRAVLKKAFCVRIDRKLVLYRYHGANLTAHLDRAFEEWLGIYVDTLRPSKWDSDAKPYARKLTWKMALRLPLVCDRSRTVELLNRALDTFGGNPAQKAMRMLSYPGVSSCFKVARSVKKLVELYTRPQIDLRLDTKALFHGDCPDFR